MDMCWEVSPRKNETQLLEVWFGKTPGMFELCVIFTTKAPKETENQDRRQEAPLIRSIPPLLRFFGQHAAFFYYWVSVEKLGTDPVLVLVDRGSG